MKSLLVPRGAPVFVPPFPLPFFPKNRALSRPFFFFILKVKEPLGGRGNPLQGLVYRGIGGGPCSSFDTCPIALLRSLSTVVIRIPPSPRLKPSHGNIASSFFLTRQPQRPFFSVPSYSTQGTLQLIDGLSFILGLLPCLRF